MVSSDHAPMNGRQAMILVVEDEPNLRKVMANVLRDAGYAVAETTNGQEALEYLRGGGPLPQLVLLDLAMPVMDGWWCYRALRTDPALAGVPVAVVTAADEEAIPTSVDGRLMKPFQVSELLATVQAQLAKGARRTGL